MQDLISEAHGLLRHQPIERRVRAKLGADTIVDSTRALLLWEPRRVPVIAVPAEDIERAGAGACDQRPRRRRAAPGDPVPGAHGRGRARHRRRPPGAGFRFEDEDLAERGARLRRLRLARGGRADPRPSRPVPPRRRARTSRSIRIEVDGEVVAETTGGRLLFETRAAGALLPAREDVRADLRPTESTSYCPYKGHASYWSLEAGGRVLEERRLDLPGTVA